MTDGLDRSVAPSGAGCVECETADGWWFHLRRCAQCGHVGCCDSSPMQHASAHFAQTGHPLVQSFEPGEDWYWDYGRADFFSGPPLADPHHHPINQAVPGPAGRVPDDWRSKIH